MELLSALPFKPNGKKQEFPFQPTLVTFQTFPGWILTSGRWLSMVKEISYRSCLVLTVDQTETKTFYSLMANFLRLQKPENIPCVRLTREFEMWKTQAGRVQQSQDQMMRCLGDGIIYGLGNWPQTISGHSTVSGTWHCPPTLVALKGLWAVGGWKTAHNPRARDPAQGRQEADAIVSLLNSAFCEVILSYQIRKKISSNT